MLPVYYDMWYDGLLFALPNWDTIIVISTWVSRLYSSKLGGPSSGSIGSAFNRFVCGSSVNDTSGCEFVCFPWYLR